MTPRMRVLWRTTLIVLAGVGLAALLLLTMRLTYAAPAQPPAAPNIVCNPGTFPQHDMAGMYESSQMLLEMYPCGGLVVFWQNDYSRYYGGEFSSVYFSEDRLPGGGVIAYGYRPDVRLNAYLDSVSVIAIKPVEPGWVHLYTITDTGVIKRYYRLMKTA